MVTRRPERPQSLFQDDLTSVSHRTDGDRMFAEGERWPRKRSGGLSAIHNSLTHADVRLTLVSLLSVSSYVA